MSSVQNANAVRCPECGFKNPAGVGPCPFCAAQQSHHPPTVATQQSPRLPAILDWDKAIAGQLVGTRGDDALRAPLVEQSDEFPATTAAHRPAPLALPGTWGETRHQPEEAAQPIQNVATRQGAEVVGRVIAIDNSQREPPDLDICRVLTKVLGTGLLLVSPLVIFGNTLVMFGPILAIAGVAGVMFLLRLLPLTNLLWFAYLAHASRRPDEQVPVWYARVRDREDESEVMVRLKGLFSRGNVAADDVVTFRGSWRNGVLMARRGFNHRTQTTIEFHRSKWWIWLILISILAMAVAIHLHGTWISLNSLAR